MARAITFAGNPLTVVGRNISAGMAAPEFHVVSHDLKEVKLADFKGRLKVITFFPSLDTPVCDLQVKEFNKRALALSQDVCVVGISKDLPFAQKRFCQENGIKNISVVSDYRTSSFGINYGVLVKELNLLARGVIIVDRQDVIRYIQIVPELTSPPDYEAAIKAAEGVLHSPAAMSLQETVPQRCSACEGHARPLEKETIRRLMAASGGWGLVEDRKLFKEFEFSDFAEAKYFLDVVAAIAQEQGHHPVLRLSYKTLRISLTTHEAGGLTENDFVMARMIDQAV